MPDPRRDFDGVYRLSRYIKKPRTIAQIINYIGMSEPTAYRWLRYIEQEGFGTVVKKDKKHWNIA